MQAQTSQTLRVVGLHQHSVLAHQALPVLLVVLPEEGSLASLNRHKPQRLGGLQGCRLPAQGRPTTNAGANLRRSRQYVPQKSLKNATNISQTTRARSKSRLVLDKVKGVFSKRGKKAGSISGRQTEIRSDAAPPPPTATRVRPGDTAEESSTSLRTGERTLVDGPTTATAAATTPAVDTVVSLAETLLARARAERRIPRRQDLLNLAKVSPPPPLTQPHRPLDTFPALTQAIAGPDRRPRARPRGAGRRREGAAGRQGGAGVQRARAGLAGAAGAPGGPAGLGWGGKGEWGSCWGGERAGSLFLCCLCALGGVFVFWEGWVWVALLAFGGWGGWWVVFLFLFC